MTLKKLTTHAGSVILCCHQLTFKLKFYKKGSKEHHEESVPVNSIEIPFTPFEFCDDYVPEFPTLQISDQVLQPFISNHPESSIIFVLQLKFSFSFKTNQ